VVRRRGRHPRQDVLDRLDDEYAIEAGLRALRFHDLRHTFGSIAINRVSLIDVQTWMGHADIKTTMRYLHHKSHASQAAMLDGAFAVAAAEALEAAATA
jgi:integrase